MSAKRINLTVTAYEGDTDFPEAEHYPEWVAEQIGERYGAEVDCSVGSSTSVYLHGFEVNDGEVEREISDLVKVELWNDFCDQGYKAYSE